MDCKIPVGPGFTVQVGCVTGTVTWPCYVTTRRNQLRSNRPMLVPTWPASWKLHTRTRLVVSETCSDSLISFDMMSVTLHCFRVKIFNHLYIINGVLYVCPLQILILYLDKYNPNRQQIQIRFLTNTANSKLQDASRSPASTPILAGKLTNTFDI